MAEKSVDEAIKKFKTLTEEMKKRAKQAKPV